MQDGKLAWFVDRIGQYLRLMRVDKPIGFVLLVCPVLWALWFANRDTPQWQHLVIFILGAFLMRSAGCVVNDYADRNLDKHVTRTQTRPITSGKVSATEALFVFGVLCVAAFALVWQLDMLTILLACGALPLVIIYPFMKRWFDAPQVILGLAFAWGVPMAFQAASGHIPLGAWIMFAAVWCWTVAYDTQYAMVDREDDLRVGIRSTAILFGDAEQVIIVVLQCMTLSLLSFAGILFLTEVWYGLSLLVVVGLFAYQFYLTWEPTPDKCLRAFRNNGWVGVTVLAGVLLSYELPTWTVKSAVERLSGI